MNSGLAFFLGMIAGAVIILFVIALFIAEEDENERRAKQIKETTIMYDKETQQEDRHKMKEEKQWM